MGTFFSSWWLFTAAYFSAPLTLLEGNVTAPALVSAIGLLLLADGIVLALVHREKRALWLWSVLLLALIAPLVIGFSQAILGWVGLLFAALAGVIGLPVWIGVIARDAARRLPVWLIGLGIFSYVIHAIMLAVLLTWGVG